MTVRNLPSLLGPRYKADACGGWESVLCTVQCTILCKSLVPLAGDSRKSLLAKRSDKLTGVLSGVLSGQRAVLFPSCNSQHC